MKVKRVFLVILTGLFVCSFVFAQSKDKNADKDDKTVEDTYMSSIQDVVITELANSDQRDNKLVALQYLEDAVDSGDASPDMVAALDQLAGEGISTQSRTNGRLANNYPDIRAKACEILGKVGTEDAAIKLNNVVKADNEPMVLSAAVRALGDIGFNDGDKISDTIAFISNRVETMNPTSSLALEVIIAYEKLLPNIKNKKPIIDSLGRIATDYHYVQPVRRRAFDLLRKMKSSDSSDDSKK